MVDGGQPLVREVGPVHAEEVAVAEFVLGKQQSFVGDAVILHSELAQFAGFSGRRDGERQPVVAMGELDRGALPQSLSETVMPLPCAGEARSSQNDETPSFTKRTVTVVSPATSSLCVAQLTRKT